MKSIGPYSEIEHSRAYSALKPEEENIPDDEFYHYNTPCTIDNQLKMLRQAKFDKAEMVWRKENTTIFISVILSELKG